MILNFIESGEKALIESSWRKMRNSIVNERILSSFRFKFMTLQKNFSAAFPFGPFEAALTSEKISSFKDQLRNPAK